ncbi:hypothetical protein GS481_03000 [Rhodococcus hoagii]|nr:hypothetical protein [Prescottella equi]
MGLDRFRGRGFDGHCRLGDGLDGRGGLLVAQLGAGGGHGLAEGHRLLVLGADDRPAAVRAACRAQFDLASVRAVISAAAMMALVAVRLVKVTSVG